MSSQMELSEWVSSWIPTGVFKWLYETVWTGQMSMHCMLIMHTIYWHFLFVCKYSCADSKWMHSHCTYGFRHTIPSTIFFMCDLPTLHVSPVQPVSQVQLLGAVQFPWRHLVWQIAVGLTDYTKWWNSCNYMYT